MLFEAVGTLAFMAYDQQGGGVDALQRIPVYTLLSEDVASD